MSRAYRISVKETLSRHVQVEDGVTSTLGLLPILSKERMRELLAAELAQGGFERDGQKASRTEGDGITLEVDLETGEVSLSAEGHSQLELTAERSAVVTDRRDPPPKRLVEDARAALEQTAQAEELVLRKKVTERLEGALRDAREELDGVVNRVTAAALKERAAQLGEIEAIHEEPNGGLTIKVRV